MSIIAFFQTIISLQFHIKYDSLGCHIDSRDIITNAENKLNTPLFSTKLLQDSIYLNEYLTEVQVIAKEI